MIRTKFFEVLKTFSKDDYIKFGHFINTDYFNTSRMLRKLYELIIKYCRDLSNEKLTRENLFSELYPGLKYREATIVNLLSGLYKLSQNYIAQEVYNTDKLSKERYLLKGLYSRKLEKFIIKFYENILMKLENENIKNDEYYYIKYEVETDYISFLEKSLLPIETEKLQSWHDRHIEYMVSRSLQTYIYMLNQQKNFYDYKFNFSFLDFMIDFLKQNSFENSPYILINFNLLMLLKEDDEQYYFKLRDLLKFHSNSLRASPKWNLYICMVNFCESKLESGKMNEKFSREVFELYREIIENKIYRIEEWNYQIHYAFYLNVVQSGLNQNELQWTESFINNLKDEIMEEHKSSSFSLAYALFYFSKKEYEQSLFYLNLIQSTHTFFSLQKKALTLQIYYERNLFEPAFSLIDSYKHFLNYDSNIQVRNKTLHKNFVDCVQKLLLTKSSKNQYDYNAFDLKEIESRNILKKDWVTEKILEIQKSEKLMIS